MTLIPAKARNAVYVALVLVNAIATGLVATDTGGQVAVVVVTIVTNIASALGLSLAAANTTTTGKHVDA